MERETNLSLEQNRGKTIDGYKYFLDILKTIAIIFVVAYHSSFSVDVSKGGIEYLKIFFKSFISLCVPVFFFVNGVLLFNKEFSLKKHIIKIIKLLAITVIWSAITILVQVVLFEKEITISLFINLLLNPQNGWNNTFWFLGALFIVYCIFPILKGLF